MGIYIYIIYMGSSKRKTTATFKYLLDFPPFFEGNDDEVSVQSKNTEGQKTLDKKKKKKA